MGKEENYGPPSGPPPSYRGTSNPSYAPPPGPPLTYRPKGDASTEKKRQDDDYAPPSGPPPSHRYPTEKRPFEDYAPPSGPPPLRKYPSEKGNGGDSYAPPPGPPPSQRYRSEKDNLEEYAPSTGPPPSFATSSEEKEALAVSYDGPRADDPPPSYHNWEALVPDTSLLPPPPSMGNQQSSTNNATEAQAMQGKEWCQKHPLTAPLTAHQLSGEILGAVRQGHLGVVKPRGYLGMLAPDPRRKGVWAGSTQNHSPDTSLSSSLPLYLVTAHSPLMPHAASPSKTIYYEVQLLKTRTSRKEISLAMGFSAPPYPTFRLPGWHRGSLAVHGDDGSRFVNDMWGGRDFTAPFKAGERIGLGMTFTTNPGVERNAYLARGQIAAKGKGKGKAPTEAAPLKVDVFFTRNGKRTGGWDLHEEGDASEDLPVTGLEGFNDLYAHVGTFEHVEFEILFAEKEWLYHP